MLRSYLYAPGNRAELLAKVAMCGADAVVLDLEDAVPKAEKAAARRTVAAWLKDRDPTDATPAYVRINGGPAALEDLAELPLDRLDGVRLPKVEDPELVRAVDSVLASAEASGRRVVLHPLVESAQGLFRLDEIVAASARIERFIFGAGDYVLDVAGEAMPDRHETLFARSYLVARSRFLGIGAPIAHVYTPIADLEALARACRVDRALGFFGRSCIHPSQVDTINAGFTFAPVDVERAKVMIEAYRASVAAGRGAVVAPNGMFVDEAGYKRALRILSVAAHTR